jgi:hypothetical protein
MVELGPDRSLSILSFSLGFYVAYLFFDAGRNFHHLKFIAIYQGLLVLIVASLLAFQTVDQYRTVKKYDEAFENRMKKLDELKKGGNTSLVELDPLPSSGMLYSAEISEDKDDFRNRFLKEALDLNFEIRLKQK